MGRERVNGKVLPKIKTRMAAVMGNGWTFEEVVLIGLARCEELTKEISKGQKVKVVKIAGPKRKINYKAFSKLVKYNNGGERNHSATRNPQGAVDADNNRQEVLSSVA